MDTVSVIIPAYNCRDTIERCIKSVVKQTYSGLIEILVVDDGSTQPIDDIIHRLQTEDQRIKYFKKENGGVSSARNYGIDFAHGDLIMFVDSDDKIKPAMLCSMVYSIDGAELVVSGVELHQNSGISIVQMKAVYTSREVIEQYGAGVPGLLLNGPGAKLYKKKIVDQKNIRFNPDISLGEDTLFVFQYLKYCQHVVFVKDTGYVYYQLSNNSLMNKFRQDGYQNAKHVYQLLMGIVLEICDEKMPESFIKVYSNVLMMYLRKIIYHKAIIDCTLIENTVVDYVNDKLVQQYYTERKRFRGLDRIIAKLIQKKNYVLLQTILELHVKIRGI